MAEPRELRTLVVALRKLRDDSDDDDDDLDVEIAWKRQFTAGSSASTASSSASANASKAARWEKAQALAEDVAQKLRMTMPCVLKGRFPMRRVLRCGPWVLVLPLRICLTFMMRS